MNADLRGLDALNRAIENVGVLRGANVVREIQAEARAAIAALSVAQGQGWLPIESAPKHEPILMLMKHGAIQGRWDGETGSGYYWRDMEWYATHWMPLPAAPAQPDGVE